MPSGSDDDRQPPSEPSFADIMNGFSFDAGRSPRRRRWGRRRGTDVELGDADAGNQNAQAAPQTPSVPVTPGPPTAPIDMPLLSGEPVNQQFGASAVRPYAWTRGRTKPGLDLAIEALVSTSQRGRDQMGLLQVEHRAVAELCEQTRSVAEVAALLSLPLGVARVLLGDMAGLGFVTVHQTASSAGNTPDLALMERVLSGLRRL
jgi:Protein of unknown function (DUF742)